MNAKPLLTLFLITSTLIFNACTPAVPIEYVVDRTDDADIRACTGAANDCTLRGAINAANSSGGSDAITFAVNGTIILRSTLPQVTDNLTIDGVFNDENIILSGNRAVQVLRVNPGKTVSLNAVSIVDAKPSYDATGGAGGGIVNYGILNVTNSTFSGNTAFLDGGGIANEGTLNVTSTTFTKNTAIQGGGIYNGTGGTVNVTKSTFSGNMVTRGGGIYNTGKMDVSGSTFVRNTAKDATPFYALGGGLYNFKFGTLTVTNSTFVDNSANEGGAIANERGGNATIVNSTIIGNFAGAFNGGGVYFVNCCDISGAPTGGTLTLHNSIIAGNFEGGDCNDPEVWVGAAVKADTYNLDSDGTCDSATTKGTRQIRLGALASNGGPTQTMALSSNSVAIGAGDDGRCRSAVGSPNYGAGGKDQRGVARPQGTRCDLGAYEFESTSPP